MPRGMDERFEDPSDETEEEDTVTDEETTEMSEESEEQGRETAEATEDQSDQQRTASTTDTDSSTSEAGETDDEPLNIREDWDSATIYVALFRRRLTATSDALTGRFRHIHPEMDAVWRYGIAQTASADVSRPCQTAR